MQHVSDHLEAKKIRKKSVENGPVFTLPTASVWKIPHFLCLFLTLPFFLLFLKSLGNSNLSKILYFDEILWELWAKNQRWTKFKNTKLAPFIYLQSLSYIYNVLLIIYLTLESCLFKKSFFPDDGESAFKFSWISFLLSIKYYYSYQASGPLLSRCWWQLA